MVDLKQLLQEIAILYHNPIDKKRLTLSFRLPDNMPPIQADRDLLLQILCNLLDNACLYTPENGWIVLELLSREKDMLFSLSNACEPINDSELPLLPERFYRSEKSRSRNLGGAGLGLAIVKKLIESQHGSLYLSSLANGLRVDFTLPKNPKIAIA